MSFSEALIYLKDNKTLTRKSWSNEDISIKIINFPPDFCSREELSSNCYIGSAFKYWRKTQKKVGIWMPSMEDILASDWIFKE